LTLISQTGCLSFHQASGNKTLKKISTRSRGLWLLNIYVTVLAVCASLAANAAPKSAAKKDPDVLGARGLDLMNQGEYKHAYKFLAEAVESRPGGIGLQYGLGVCAAHIQETEAALNAFTKVIVMTSHNQPMHAKVANLLLTQYRSTPYSCLNHTISPPGLIRWGSDAMPLKIYISDGKELPAKFNQRQLQPDEIKSLYSWVKSPDLMNRLGAAPGYKAEFRQSAANGLGLWEWASKEKVVSFELTNDHRAADVILFWCGTLYNNGATVYLPRTAGAPAIIICSVSGTGSLDKTASDRAIANFVAHEFGHALGLGHSLSQADLMYTNFDGIVDVRQKECTSSDKLTLRALYAIPANTYLNPVVVRKKK